MTKIKRTQQSTNMDWNSSSSSKFLRSPPFVSCPNDSFHNISCNSHLLHPLPVLLEVKQHDEGERSPQCQQNMVMKYTCGTNQEKRNKRLTTDQLESLENSFHADGKLESCRKMRLAQDLGLEPRQVAVWFQNRRARWKAKKLEHLYDALKQDYALVFREKQKLQEEVVRLKSMVKEVSKGKQASLLAYKEVGGGGGGVGGDEDVESTIMIEGVRRCKKHGEGSEGISNVDQFNEASPSPSPSTSPSPLFDVNYFPAFPQHYYLGGAYS